jgi:hypothetical protein
MRDLVREQPQAVAPVRPERPGGEVHVGPHGERPRAKRPAGLVDVSARVVHPDRGEVNPATEVTTTEEIR